MGINYWYKKENGEIDREKVIDELERDLVREPDEQTHIISVFDQEAVEGALELLKSDCLVKVIRCKDCQMWRSPSKEDISDGITTGFCNNAGFGTEPFGFCSDAIRR